MKAVGTRERTTDEERARQLIEAELRALEEPAADVALLGGSYREAPRVVPKSSKLTRYDRFLVRMQAIDWEAALVVALLVFIATMSITGIVLGEGP